MCLASPVATSHPPTALCCDKATERLSPASFPSHPHSPLTRYKRLFREERLSPSGRPAARSQQALATEAPLVTLPAWPHRPRRTPGTETPKETPEAPERQRGPAPHCGPPAPAQQLRPPPGPQAPAPQRPPHSAVPPPGPAAAGQGAPGSSDAAHGPTGPGLAADGGGYAAPAPQHSPSCPAASTKEDEPRPASAMVRPALPGAPRQRPAPPRPRPLPPFRPSRPWRTAAAPSRPETRALAETRGYLGFGSSVVPGDTSPQPVCPAVSWPAVRLALEMAAGGCV